MGGDEIMALDPADFIEDLTPTEPPFDDPASQADDHTRAIKKAIKQTFPGTFDGPLNLTPSLIEGLDARLDALEAVPVTAYFPPVSGKHIVTATGVQAITGVGFKPSVVIATTSAWSLNNTAQVCVGAASVVFAPAGICMLANNYAGGGKSSVENLFYALTTSNATNISNTAEFVSFDADGFTIDVTALTVLDPHILWTAFS